MHHYGIDVSELEDLIRTPQTSKTEYGSRALLASTPHYRLEQLIVGEGGNVALEMNEGEEATLFVEEGSIRVNSSILESQNLTTLAASSGSVQAVGLKRSALYAFYGPAQMSGNIDAVSIASPTDFREKYWGSIQTMLNREYTGKRLFFRKGENSSLHFHCQKTETYFIHSGELYVRLRAGRGQDRFFVLRTGDTLFIPPGLMHQDGGLEDTVIIEISTHDEDSDSFIVEDGATNRMPGLAA